MVKNSGGNKSKKVARKNVAPNNIVKDVRQVSEPGEMYAAISKIYSSRRCDVVCSDGNQYQCNVRGKFLKSKNGGNNALAVGVWVMVGFYDWEVRSDGKKNCDLLEIYSPDEKEKLKQLESKDDLKAIMKIGELEGTEKEFAFSQFKEDTIVSEDSLSSNEEDEADEDDMNKSIKSKVKIPVVPKPKEMPQDQLDWLAIDERDI